MNLLAEVRRGVVWKHLILPTLTINFHKLGQTLVSVLFQQKELNQYTQLFSATAFLIFYLIQIYQ